MKKAEIQNEAWLDQVKEIITHVSRSLMAKSSARICEKISMPCKQAGSRALTWEKDTNKMNSSSRKGISVLL